MNGLQGTSGSPWGRFVRRPPAATILAYLHESWQDYVRAYSHMRPALAERDEPTLTQGFGAFLAERQALGAQPFDGDFIAERSLPDLLPNGTAKVIGRTDIEWLLCGTPSFVVEFKVVGGGRPASAYTRAGVARFVAGQYGKLAVEGAMWAFLRPGCGETDASLEQRVEREAATLLCRSAVGPSALRPSGLAPAVASFDTIHVRAAPLPVIRLAHVFVALP